ncbi:hypothetical protein [Antribacter gilvus]|uniref:hypothetical protein n=1 Tax=Antribacter gilvus TaxID=2304675 RepID=UPI0013DE87A7|nr:hypothetical protein [Antribacter gilvus]
MIKTFRILAVAAVGAALTFAVASGAQADPQWDRADPQWDSAFVSSDPQWD